MQTGQTTAFHELVHFAAKQVTELTTRQHVPLGDDDSPPWLELAVVTEIDTQVFRELLRGNATASLGSHVADKSVNSSGRLFVGYHSGQGPRPPSAVHFVEP